MRGEEVGPDGTAARGGGSSPGSVVVEAVGNAGLGVVVVFRCLLPVGVLDLGR